MLETLISQLLDLFRIGLIFFLLMTALRTREAAGLVMPLSLGVVFVAILIPLTTGAAAVTGNTSLYAAIGIGVVSNAIILVCFLAAWYMWARTRH